MAASKLKTPVDMLCHWEKTAPDRVYLRQPRDRVFREYTWSEVGTRVRRMAAALQALGMEPGDRVGILSKNCAEWIMADLAIMASGCISVPLYPNQTAETTRYILEHSETKLVFTGKLDDWQGMEAGIPEGVIRVGMPYPGMRADHSWEELLAGHAPIKGNPKRALDDIATIIYTSGTTGNPKGVEHSFEAVSFAASNAVRETGIGLGDRAISYLPLSHVAERLLIEMASLYCGMKISFAESLDTFIEDLQSVSPTIFFSVPRLWTRFQMGVLEKLPQKKLDFLLRVPVVRDLIASKIRKNLGLDCARITVSGAAAISPALLDWYLKIGIEIQEGYAMTENFAYGTFNLAGSVRRGTVGRPMPGCEIRIDDNGEILFRTKANMIGYYLEPEKTAEVLKDGWLYSGDRGELDSEGYLRITGRVKEIFKTSKGKYVAPSPVEGKLAENTDIEQICVMGTNMPQPVAVIVLSEAARTKPKDEIEKELAKTLESVNQRIEPHERLDCLIVAGEPWAIENGMLTPTLKVKRHVVEKKFQEIAEAAGSDKPVVWASA